MDDGGLVDSLQQASVLMMTKVLEGLGTDSHAEFIQRLDAAHQSAAEIQRLLRAARDQACITAVEFTASYEHAESVRQRVASFMTYLQTSRQEFPPVKAGLPAGRQGVIPLPGGSGRWPLVCPGADGSLGRHQVVGELARGAIFDV
jgi:four helix bundle protein